MKLLKNNPLPEPTEGKILFLYHHQGYYGETRSFLYRVWADKPSWLDSVYMDETIDEYINRKSFYEDQTFWLLVDKPERLKTEITWVETVKSYPSEAKKNGQVTVPKNILDVCIPSLPAILTKNAFNNPIVLEALLHAAGTLDRYDESLKTSNKHGQE